MTLNSWISSLFVIFVVGGSPLSLEVLAFPGYQSAAANEHSWIEPNPATEARSPCPGMNTAANHGYLNRSGRDIPLVEIAQVLEDLFSYNASESMSIFRLFQTLGLETGTNDQGQTTLLSFQDLYDERFLHDASFVHEDPGIVGGGSQQPYSSTSTSTSLELWEELKAASTDGQVLTLEDLLSHQIVRAKDSLKNNPDSSLEILTSFYVRTLLAGEKMFLLLAGGHETLQQITLQAAEDFLIDNRLPEGYLPRQDRQQRPNHLSSSSSTSSGESIAAAVVVDFKTDFTKEIHDYFFEGIQNGLLQQEEGAQDSVSSSQGTELLEEEEGWESQSSSSSSSSSGESMANWSLRSTLLLATACIFLYIEIR